MSEFLFPYGSYLLMAKLWEWVKGEKDPLLCILLNQNERSSPGPRELQGNGWIHLSSDSTRIIAKTFSIMLMALLSPLLLSKPVICVTRLLVGRLCISFNPCKSLMTQGFISSSSSNLPWKCCKTKVATNAQSLRATKSCRNEFTQDQNPPSDHNINGSALWVFCIGKGWSPISGGRVLF